MPKHFYFFYLLLFCTVSIVRPVLAVETRACSYLSDEESCDEVFELTLESALSRALNFNRQLFNSIDAVVKSNYGIELAKDEFNLQITPNSQAGYVGGGYAGEGISIGVGMGFFKKFQQGTQISVEPSVNKIKDHYHSNVRTVITQPLLRGLGREYTLANLRGAQYSFRSACRALYIAQMQLVTRTISSLYDVIKAKKSVELNEASYDRISKFYEAAKLKERIGLSDALDVYRAEIEFQHAQDNLINAHERLQEAEDVLREILALPLDTCLKINVPIKYTASELSVEEAVEIAFKNRVEMDQAREQWQENQRLSRLAKDRLYPELNLVLNYSNCGRDEIFTRSCHYRHRESTWGIGFTTSSDFDLTSERVGYEQALLAVSSAERGIDQTKATLNLEVKRALRTLSRAHKRIVLQEKQIKTAQGELYLSQLKFDRGMANNFDVIQAEKSLHSAQLAFWTALIDHLVGEYQLLGALGLLTDKPCIK